MISSLPCPLVGDGKRGSSPLDLFESATQFCVLLFQTNTLRKVVWAGQENGSCVTPEKEQTTNLRS